ncbi:MAG: YeeE/YedE family protein [SAR324 cluster bacterium]|nr:YeeE/YedE family protein [SAR324 cluster bacterium]
MENIEIKQQPYWPNILAGIGLGLVLLLAYYVAGRGLGGSGALARASAGLAHLLAPEHTEGLTYYSRYFENGKVDFNDWLVFQLFGVFLGGLFGAVTAGRFGKAVDKGKRITNGQRFFFATIGGILMGWGARLAKGCTSGQALSGGATLAVGSWAFMLALFAGGFITAFFVRRLWI